MCSQDDAPDTKKHFTRDPVQDGWLSGDKAALLSTAQVTAFFPPLTQTPAGEHLTATSQLPTSLFPLSCEFTFQRYFW